MVSVSKTQRIRASQEATFLSQRPSLSGYEPLKALRSKDLGAFNLQGNGCNTQPCISFAQVESRRGKPQAGSPSRTDPWRVATEGTRTSHKQRT